MKKRFKRLLCVLLLMCLCFSEVVVSPNVNTTISEAKKKNTDQFKIKKIGKGRCLYCKKSKPFLKYLSWNADRERVEFDYTGDDEVIYIPGGPVFIKNFRKPGEKFNDRIKKIYLCPSFTGWTEGCYFDNDTNWYSVFYTCSNLERVYNYNPEKRNLYWHPQATKDGTYLFFDWHGRRPIENIWKYGERLPANS